jgi:hypothetical protein
MKEVLNTSDTSVLPRPTRRNIPEDTILHHLLSSRLHIFESCCVSSCSVCRIIFLNKFHCLSSTVKETVHLLLLVFFFFFFFLCVISSWSGMAEYRSWFVWYIFQVFFADFNVEVILLLAVSISSSDVILGMSGLAFSAIACSNSSVVQTGPPLALKFVWFQVDDK